MTKKGKMKVIEGRIGTDWEDDTHGTRTVFNEDETQTLNDILFDLDKGTKVRVTIEVLEESDGDGEA